MYLYIEGINHNAVLFDTNDISTIRGGSYLLETLADEALKDIKGVLVDSGASKAVIRFLDADQEDVRRALAGFLAGPVWSQFSLATGIADTAEAARAQAQIAALSMWSWPRPRDLAGPGQDPEDHTRAATERETAKSRETGPLAEKQMAERFVSPFVALRRAAARRERPILFTESNLVPPLHFEDIVWHGNRILPPVVKGKIAVIAVDGMGGGVMARSYEGTDGGFAKAMTKFRAHLAREINAWVEEQGLWFTMSGSKQKISQCDVLLWGGDDMAFALPASHAVRFVQMLMKFFSTPFDPGVVETPFPHRIGCVIAKVKTPFRQMLKLAWEIEYYVKAGLPEPKGPQESAAAFVVFESASLPFEGIKQFRKELYGTGYNDRAEIFMRSELNSFADFCQNEVSPDDAPGVLSITQINRVLNAIQQVTGQSAVPTSISTQRADEIAMRVLADHYRRYNGAEAPIEHWMSGIGGRGVALWLAQIADLRPYMIGEFIEKDVGY